MALKSDELSLELTRRLEEEADDLSIGLDGQVYLLQSRDGVVLLKDELDAQLVVDILKQFLEDAVRAKVKDE